MADRIAGRSGTTEHDTTWLARMAVMGAFALVLATLLIGGVWLTARPLALLFAAIVIAEAAAPLIDRASRVVPRGVGVGVLYLGLAAGFGGLLWYLAPTLVTQARELADQAPATIERLRSTVQGWDIAGGNDVLSKVTDGLSRFTDVLIALPMTIVSTALDLVLVVAMSAYWLLTRSRVARFARSLAPANERGRVQRVLEESSSTVGGYVRGTLISALLVGTIVYIGLLVIGVDYALVLALVAGFGEIIPVVGPVFAAVPTTLVAFATSPTQGLIVLVFYVIVQQIESNLITPNVMSHETDIPPLLVLIALSIGAALGGIVGGLVAIPLAGVLKVLIVEVVAPFVRRWTGASDAPTTVEQAQESRSG